VVSPTATARSTRPRGARADLGAVFARAGAIVWLLVALAAISAARSPAELFLIAPGEGIGALHLGMTLGEAEATMRRPKSTFPLANGEDTIHTWFATVRNADGTVAMGGAGGLYAVVDASGKIRQVGAHYAPRYMTSNGLHTGVAEATVRAVLGEPPNVYPQQGYHELAYPALGITCSIVDDQRIGGYKTVYEIVVYPPTQ